MHLPTSLALSLGMLLAASASFSCGQEYSADAADEFTNINKAYEAAYDAGDAAAAAALHTEDATIMPPNGEPVQGRPAIAAFIEQDMATIGGKFKLEMIEHAVCGDQGWARGTYAVIGTDGTTIDQGKWVDVRKRIEGKWLIEVDIWNSDKPVAAGE